MEFSTIDHREDPSQDWRAAYREAVDNNAKQLEQDKRAQIRRRIYLGTDTYVVKDMTREQIQTVARRLAEKDCDRGIIMLREANDRSKLRAGEAL